MAIEYDMDLYDRNGPLDPTLLCNGLAETFSPQEKQDNSFGDPNGLIVTVWSWNDAEAPSETAERKALGFPYKGVNIGFRQQGNYDESSRQMVRIVNWLLEHYPVDVKLTYNDLDNVILFRSRGRLVLVDRDAWRYDPTLRTLITLPYEYRKASVYFDLTVFSEKRKLHPMAVGNMFIAKFGMLLHPHDAPRRICEGLIATPYRFDDTRPHDFSKPHDHGENLGIHFEVDVLSYEAGLAKLVAITRWVLEQYDGDATLEWHPEWNVEAPPLLTRTNNTITLSDEPDFWTPERKAIMLGKPLP